MAGENNSGKISAALWRGKVDQTLHDIREDVGFIREEIGRMCARIEDNTTNISKQKVRCDERMKNVATAEGHRQETKRLGLTAKATIAASVITAIGAMVVAVITCAAVFFA